MTQCQVIKAPNPLPFETVNGKIPKSVFLAGSIEMGAAENWQEEATNRLWFNTNYIFNPRRESWDSSWVQDISNSQFREQVNWELTALDISNIIFMYFAPTTKSPISLLELGLYASSRKMVVCCPDGFWRRGNVQIVCNRYAIPLFSELKSSLDYVIDEFKYIKDKNV